MPRAVLALAATLAAAAAAAQPSSAPPAQAPSAPKAAQGAPPAPPPSPPAEKPVLPRGAVLEEVSGTVRELDRTTYRLVVETSSGDVTLSLDRNTMVYTAGGLATVLDVKPGTRIRAGRNADFLAYWVQVRTVTQEPASTPGQGTGPAGGGSAPAGEAGGPATGGAPGPGGGGPGSAPGGGPGNPSR